MMTSPKIAVPAFLMVAITVLTVAVLLVRSSGFASDPTILAWALSFDIMVLVPSFYAFLAHKMRWPRTSVIPVFLLSLFVASRVLPSDHNGLVGVSEYIVLPIELFAILYVGFKLRKIRRERQAISSDSGDFVEAVETVLSRMVSNRRFVQLAVTEASVIHYGFFAWKKARELATGEFTYHRENSHGAVTGVFVFLILIETTLIHLVLVSKVPVLAWVLVALSIYGALFLVADYNAARRRPIIVEHGLLRLRIGFRWRATIKLEDIQDIDASSADIDDKKGLLSATLLSGHNVVFRLRQPHTAKGLYGITKMFDRVALSIDNVTAFETALRGKR